MIRANTSLYWIASVVFGGVLACRGKIESIAEAPESRTVKDADVAATSASATSERKFAADRPPPREVIDWLRANAIPLTTPEPGHGFDDLLPLKQVVGNARIVALGEATHGTREFFQLKHRILEFLATEMGFTVFTIEASYPDALAVNDYVVNGRGDPRDALAGARFWAWETEEVLDLVKWMRRYNEDPGQAKLEFHGFDINAPSGAVQRALDYLEKVDPGFAARDSADGRTARQRL